MGEESFTIVITGDTGTGKTSLLHRISKNTFVENLNPTIAGDISPIDVYVDGVKVQLMIWDTSGTEDYKSMNASHFADAQGILYFYSVDNTDSLENVTQIWQKEVEANSTVPHINFLAGNKIDLPESEICVTNDRECAIQNDLHAPEFIRVSAKTGDNVKVLLQQLASKLLSEYGNSCGLSTTPPPNNDAGKGGCCLII